jgi:multisubunit Na+/H+ antiporter MnhE subunit
MPAALAWLVWWILSAAFWLLLVDKTQFQELVLGAIVAAMAATGAVLVRRQRAHPLTIRPSWLLGAWRPLLGMVTDLPTLVRALARPDAGRLTELPFEVTADGPEPQGYRVLTTALGSLAPNTVIVDLDRKRGRLLVHQLIPTDDPRRDACPLPPYEGSP